MKVYTFTDEDVSLCGGIMFAAVYRALASLIEGESAAFLARGDNPVGEKGSLTVLSEMKLYRALFPFVSWKAVAGCVTALNTRGLIKIEKLATGEDGDRGLRFSIPDVPGKESSVERPKEASDTGAVPKDFIELYWNKAKGLHHYRLDPEEHLVKLKTRTRKVLRDDFLKAFERFAVYHETRKGAPGDNTFGFGDQLQHFVRNIEVFLDEKSADDVTARHRKRWYYTGLPAKNEALQREHRVGSHGSQEGNSVRLIPVPATKLLERAKEKITNPQILNLYETFLTGHDADSVDARKTFDSNLFNYAEMVAGDFNKGSEFLVKAKAFTIGDEMEIPEEGK